MTTTNNFGVTLLESSQAQKEITINEAFGVFDAVLKGSVLDKDLSTPPGTPAAGDSYLVAASPTGAWSGKANSIAYFDTVWRFITPQNGTRVWVSDESATYMYSGGTWGISGGGTVGATLGGTGQTSYTTGDLLQASSGSALSKLAAVATGNTLLSGGVGAVSSWGKVGLSTHVSGTLPVANGGTGDTGTAWSTYTPTVTAGSGTFTSVSATGRYKTLGKTVFVQIAVTITTNGTATTNVRVTLPNTVAGFHYMLSGRETNSTGVMLNAVAFASTNFVYITKYDNTYIGANGYVLSVSGVYEMA